MLYNVWALHDTNNIKCVCVGQNWQEVKRIKEKKRILSDYGLSAHKHTHTQQENYVNEINQIYVHIDEW